MPDYSSGSALKTKALLAYPRRDEGDDVDAHVGPVHGEDRVEGEQEEGKDAKEQVKDQKPPRKTVNA